MYVRHDHFIDPRHRLEPDRTPLALESSAGLRRIAVKVRKHHQERRVGFVEVR